MAVLKRYDGSQWVTPVLRRYNGTTWECVTLNRYDGAGWVEVETACAPLPGALSDLQLWLDAQTLALADGAAINTMTDQSPAARAITTNDAPTYRATGINSLPSVHFILDNLAAAHDANINLHADSTVFVVLKLVGNVQNNLVSQGVPGTPSAYCLYLYNDKPTIDRPWVAGGTAATNALTVGTPTLITARISGTTVNHYKNGVANGSSSLANGTAGTSRVEIGRWEGSFPFDGHIGELLIYNVALGATDREAVESYLMDKWGL